MPSAKSPESSGLILKNWADLSSHQEMRYATWVNGLFSPVTKTLCNTFSWYRKHHSIIKRSKKNHTLCTFAKIQRRSPVPLRVQSRRNASSCRPLKIRQNTHTETQVRWTIPKNLSIAWTLHTPIAHDCSKVQKQMFHKEVALFVLCESTPVLV